jgi:hypothetical protein
MSDFLINFLLFSGVFTLIGEFSAMMTYGKIMDDVDVLTYLGRYESFSINRFENSILSGDIDWSDYNRVVQKIREGDYISNTRFSLLSKYYIAGKGRVWRWSRGHKKINNLYKTSEIK